MRKNQKDSTPVIRPHAYYVEGGVAGSGYMGGGEVPQGWVVLEMSLLVGGASPDDTDGAEEDDLENDQVEQRGFLLRAEEARHLALWLLDVSASAITGANVGKFLRDSGFDGMSARKFSAALSRYYDQEEQRNEQPKRRQRTKKDKADPVSEPL